ncbi:3-hydroxyacyl-CoA dehydrogenase NAD-binding domain-containing protein [Profundibacterium mesophilum]|uniref:3-hydroxyacyl-CoA dehydrogenase n=1 Tax=Profundibacterium mesophilum KAUST100406-0324 TaxID=1037889 RepID=A0A921TCA9_9RHOB|nr:3-hydroxyacyl-CoA dehydrogenase NAD-binding domain-containing protein [Profundibacterium mesophilum]KAF0676875.1 3-hydroxyacyl-CoA dehydrogenase [Profundibacterium mesophilum KAUST100406-0324]
MSEPVTYRLEGRIALVTIDNQPVNALSHAVREGLDGAITRFAGDDAAEALLLTGAGRVFLGGADITEFGKPPRAPSLPDVITAIEGLEKPVIAAIHGVALGGGLEVALGAHYRLAMPGTSLGLPEVKLGILPGAGGTQRAPRLVGVAAALDMITSGTPIGPEKALEIGLIDRIGSGDDPAAAGLAYAEELLAAGAQARPVGALPMPQDAPELFEARRAALEKSARGEIAPLTALDAVRAATRLPIGEGLEEERRLFQQLLDSPQRAGMIHAFFNDRKVAKLPEIAGVAPRDFASVGVIGGGTMGAGIATAALLAGLRVSLVERDADAAERARATIEKNLAAAVKRGKLGQERRDAILSGALDCVTGYEVLGGADVIIEAVFESMDVKKEVFAQIDRVARPGTVLATNTSYLDINEIARATSRPQDVIGLHFFSPAHVMKLLEIVVAGKTAPEVTATAFALGKALGKTCVRAGVCDGFIGNRILSHYRAAADHMVLDGASPYQIDAALRDFGFPMGPYQVADLAGLDIGYMTRQRKADQRHERDRYPGWADTLYEMGRLGQKSGRGYYIYDEQSPRGRLDPEVEEIIAAEREAQGIRPRDFTDEEIVERYMAAMVNEGARVVDEGIAQRPLDVDVTLLYGYGFPRHRGGPMHYADTAGLGVIRDRIQRYAGGDDHFWQVAPLLARLADDQSTFASLNG